MRWSAPFPGSACCVATDPPGWARTSPPAWCSRALLVPQGMAYAELAGLPPITGLYTTVLCLLGYAAFGPSKVLVLGPDSSLGPMIAATVIPLVTANGDPGRAVAYASMLALMVGAITIAAGVFRLGFIADLLSKPTQIGYMNGLALTIVIGQLPKLFGFSVDGDGLDRRGDRVRREASPTGGRCRPRWRSESGPCSSSCCSTASCHAFRGCWSPSCWRSPRWRCSTWRTAG